MPVQAYVNFDKQCEEAVSFYSNVFQTPVVEMIRYGDMPNPDYPMDEAAANLLMHAELKIEGDIVMFGDFFPGTQSVFGNNVQLTVVTDDPEKTRRYYELLKEGGQVEMELQETFWSPLYASIIDKFGIYWQFSTSKTA